MDRLHDFDSWSSQSFSEIEGWWHFKFIFKKLSEVFPWIIHWWKGLVLLCVHFLCFWGVALFKMTRNTLSHLGLASPVLPLRSRVIFFLIYVGCSGQLTHITTILHGPLNTLQAQEQVRHHGGDRRAHRGSNPGQGRNKSHDWPQQLNPQLLIRVFWFGRWATMFFWWCLCCILTGPTVWLPEIVFLVFKWE